MQQNLAGRTRHESTFTVRPLRISKKRKNKQQLGFFPPNKIILYFEMSFSMYIMYDVFCCQV